MDKRLLEAIGLAIVASSVPIFIALIIWASG